jgi:hypothetical protein
MNKELIEIIGIERQRYVDYFEETVNTLKLDKTDFAIELPIQTNDETISAPFNIIRVDFITKNPNGEYSISDLRLDRLLDFSNKRFSFDKLQIDVKPFCWNNCQCLTDNIDVFSLKKWIVKWQKVEEDLIDEQLSQAIHSCTEPERDGNMFAFMIDFGTAPEKAWTDFLEVLNDTGTTELKIQTTEV